MTVFYKHLTFACLVFAGLFYQSCSTKAPVADTPTSPIEIFRSDITYLASDELEGREAGTRGEHLAAAYIAERFESLGLEPGGDHGTYYQEFEGVELPHPHADEEEGKTVTGINVIGFIDNDAPHTVVLGAHYDHLGWGGNSSLHRSDTSAIHYGADDNASGVAMILYLAQRLREAHPGSNYLFIAFSGEEKGLWGSGYWTKNPTPVEVQEVNYMFNFDMVGRLNDERTLAINGTGTSALWERRLERANRANLNLVFSQSGVGSSDHTSFYLVEVPAIHFFTGTHEDYHRPSDTPDKINYLGMQEIGSIVFNLIGALNEDPKLTFSETVVEESRSAPRFSVTLGIVPDYLYSGSGLRIEGVTSGNPAEKAGLQRGDIIIKLGDRRVNDIYDYMEGLSDFTSGDETSIQYKRDGEIQESKVIF